MKWIVFSIILVTGASQQLSAQLKDSTSGKFSLGARSTFSFFDHHGSTMGVGAGGQFRIQISERVNTEWYLDYLSSNIDKVIGRQDAHIGWSVFFYYLKNNSSAHKLLQPFFEAGHCFDYTKMNEIGTLKSAERWSSAVQMGTGLSFNLTPRFDATTKVQYMIHLGSDIDASVIDDGHSHTHVDIAEHKGSVNLEGHLLCTISFNYKLGHLWTR